MKVILGCLIMCSMSACSVGWSLGQGVAFAGSPEGVQAFYDGENGLIANARTQDANSNSAHWEHRRIQEQEKTKRSGFWQKLTGSDSTRGS